MEGLHLFVNRFNGCQTDFKKARRFVWDQVQPSSDSGKDVPTAAQSIHVHERAACELQIRTFIDRLEDLIDITRQSEDAELYAALKLDLSPDRLTGLAKRTADRLEKEEPIPTSYLDFCTQEVEHMLDERGDTGLQWAATLIAGLPVTALIAEVVLTGGLSLVDFGAAVATAFSTPSWQWLIDKLGQDVVNRVRQNWIETRSVRIKTAAIAEALPSTAPQLVKYVDRWDETQTSINALTATLNTLELE